MGTRKSADKTAYESVMRQAKRDREDARRYRELLECVREITADMRQVYTRAELRDGSLAWIYQPMRVLSKGIK